MKTTIWKKLEAYPPILCRLLARKGKGRFNERIMTDEEIAEVGNMKLSDVKSLSWKTSWDDVPFRQVRQFSMACRVDFTDTENMKKHVRLINRKTQSFWHIRKSSHREKFTEMLRVWARDNQQQRRNHENQPR